MEPKEIKLKSGNVLRILDTPFAESQALFKAVINGFKAVEVDETVKDLDEFVGALIGAQISDDEVGKAMWGCLARCTYGETKIIPSMFDAKPEAREDFIDICLEVGQENLRPFMKGLCAALPRLTKLISEFRKPK